MKQFIKSLFTKQPKKEFTNIPMDKKEGDIEKILNVSEERMRSMQKQITEIMDHPEDYKIIEKTDKGLLINGPILLDILANKIPTTDAERVVLLIQFHKMTEVLKRQYMSNPLEELMNLLKNH